MQMKYSAINSDMTSLISVDYHPQRSSYRRFQEITSLKTMESLYHQTNALLQQIHLGLGALENAKDESDAQKTVQIVYEQLRWASISFSLFFFLFI